jgi:hypothetical protein
MLLDTACKKFVVISATECNISWRRENLSTLIKYRSLIIGPEIRYIPALKLIYPLILLSELKQEENSSVFTSGNILKVR